MRSITVLVAVLLLCTGCSFSMHRSLAASEVQGFGSGTSQTEAKKAAWDDAFTRIEKMGLERYRVAENGTVVNSNGQGRYDATVTLRVEADEE